MIVTTWCSPVNHAYWKKELGWKFPDKSEQDNDSCSECTVLAVYTLSQLPLEKLFCFAVFIFYKAFHYEPRLELSLCSMFM